MKKILQMKLSLGMALALMVASAVAGWSSHAVFFSSTTPDAPVASTTNKARYEAAVEDAMTIEADEIQPLVSLAPGAPFSTYDEAGRVLLLTYHATPSAYPAGVTQTVSDDVWLVAPGELADWFEKNGDDVTDWPLRLQELLGLAPNDHCSHFTAMWVDPADVIRPANVQATGDVNMVLQLSEDTAPDLKEWFDDNIIWSYFDSAYPWTRLGYTYDWSENADDEYGLSEFLVRSDTTVEIAYTVSTDQMLDMFADDSWNPAQ